MAASRPDYITLDIASVETTCTPKGEFHLYVHFLSTVPIEQNLEYSLITTTGKVSGHQERQTCSESTRGLRRVAYLTKEFTRGRPIAICCPRLIDDVDIARVAPDG